MRVLAFMDDLMFLSRIRAAGPGLQVSSARSAEVLVEACREGDVLVLADLDSRRLDALAAIVALRAEPATQATTVIGFVSHVDTERAAAAREAGCSRVMARSAFVRELPALLAEWGGGS